MGANNFCSEQKRPFLGPLAPLDKLRRRQPTKGLSDCSECGIFIVFEKVLWVQTIFAQSRKDPSLVENVEFKYSESYRACILKDIKRGLT